MNVETLFENFKIGFVRRKFSAGLLVALIDLFTELKTYEYDFNSFSDFLKTFSRKELTAGGGGANTLIVDLGDRTLSLRPYYDAIENYYRSEQKRFDYPSCAPHATQAWSYYHKWLDALAGFSREELTALRAKVNAFVLDALPSQAFDPSDARHDPPLFRIILEEFDLVAKKEEKTGAAFQGVVFGFIRADNPHLQVEIDKVRTGSKRLQRVGDVDAWEGAKLAISVEVKHFLFKAAAIDNQIEGFANEINRRGALGIIVALGFETEARDAINSLGLEALDRADMLNVVKLWDPVKQLTAVNSFVYYAKHVEKSSALTGRLNDFVNAAITSAASGAK